MPLQKIIFLILTFGIAAGLESLVADISGNHKVALIRVEFQTDDSEGTTGNGRFLLEKQDYCFDTPVDPPPHDKSYFLSHLQAADTYFETVSKGQYRLDIEHSSIFPVQDQMAYELDTTMSYYHPFLTDTLHEKRLTRLFYDAVNLAYEKDSINFDDYDIIIVVHAGVGQDFNLPFLDPTPEDIPSAFIDQNMLSENLGLDEIILGQSGITKGIIIPETQNLLLYEDTSVMFEGTSSPCDYQYSLAGTLTLMLGFYAGLPPLWNTDSGESGVGVFSLMDQGSNNLSGIVPAIPDAWSRLYAGWENLIIADSAGHYQLSAFSDSSVILKVPVSDNEYFLVENRIYWFMDTTGVEEYQIMEYEETGTFSSPLEILFNVSGSIIDENGIFSDIPNYDMGLPASGILIWHVNERIIEEKLQEYAINNDIGQPGIDLEEADGAQDIGYPSIHLFTDPSSGYFGDIWFTGNREYEGANPGREGEDPVFGPGTFPDTRDASGSDTDISITIRKAPGYSTTVSVQFGSSVFGPLDHTLGILFAGDITGDGHAELIGKNDSLWYSQVDELDPVGIPSTTGTGLDKILVSNQNGNDPALGFLFVGAESTILQVYDFDGNMDSLVNDWDVEIPDTDYYHFEGVVDKKAFKLYGDDGHYYVTREGYQWVPGSAIYPTQVVFEREGEDKILVHVQENGYLLRNDTYNRELTVDGRIIQIAGCDVDRNGLPEILTLDENGALHLYSLNLVSMSGFPIHIAGIPPVLVGDIIDDDTQDLVLLNQHQDLLIVNSKGKIRKNYSVADEIRLVGLGHHDSSTYVITTGGALNFKDGETSRPDWPLPAGDAAGTRQFSLTSDIPVEIYEGIIKKSQTYAYPNPSRKGKVTFRITSGSGTQADIRVYDLAGEPVWSRYNIDLAPGEVREVDWITSEVESGIYLVRVNAENDSESTYKILKIGIIQ